MSTPHHPLLKAQEIDYSLQPKSHYLKPEAVRYTACLSDMVGMKGLGIHKARLDPNTDSTAIHYHLQETEWVYILSGSGKLRLIDASLSKIDISRATGRHAAALPASSQQGDDEKQYEVEERDIGPGDFIGFQGGIEAARYAHALRAGDEGLEYLVGGTREKVDVCSYPETGQTNVFEWRTPQPQGFKSAKAPTTQSR